MTEGQKLAVLLLYLEMNPEELDRYKKDDKYARAQMERFGLSQPTIDVVVGEDLVEFGKLFETVKVHAGVGVAVIEPKRPKK